MNVTRQEIGGRLKDWALKKFGNLGDAAKALKISQSQLSQYIHGYYLPGNKIQDKLHELKCDLTWLMTGMTIEETNARWEKMKEGFLPPDDRAMLNKLHELNILTLADLKDKLNWEKLYEKKKEPLKMVAEPQAKYQPTKNKKEGKR